MEGYDSIQDTLDHKLRVAELLGEAAMELMRRGAVHDNSKLTSPEKSAIDRVNSRLRGIPYDGPEYKAVLSEMGDALKHHYENNSHHPEHYKDGIGGMTLFDIVEMFFDWKASSERQDGGDIKEGLEKNAERFGISPQLYGILQNTARELGW